MLFYTIKHHHINYYKRPTPALIQRLCGDLYLHDDALWLKLSLVTLKALARCVKLISGVIYIAKSGENPKLLTFLAVKGTRKMTNLTHGFLLNAPMHETCSHFLYC